MNKEKIIEVGLKKRKGEINQTWEELNKELNFPFKNGESFRSFIKKNIKNKNEYKKFDDSRKNYKSTHTINSDGTQTSDKLLEMSEEDQKNPEYLLIAHGFSVKDWILVSARNNIWNTYSKKDGINTLYSSKITVKPRTDFEWTIERVQKIFNNLKTDYKSKINIIPKQYYCNGNALIIPIADLHYGLSSDIISTGNEYNLEIAENLYYYIINDVINRNKLEKFEKIFFIIGNDFINSDNLSSTTTKGTVQDSIISWFKIVETATQLIKNGIDMLTEVAPVEVVFVPSNHDLHTMFGIMQTINAKYEKNNKVIIDTSPLPRKYNKFGKTLLSFSHDIKIKDSLKIISSEAKNMWSDSEHIICMLAHLHQAMIYDKQGYLEIFRLPTISGWSRWSNNKGYIQTEKKNQSFIINKDNGIINIINTIL